MELQVKVGHKLYMRQQGTCMCKCGHGGGQRKDTDGRVHLPKSKLWLHHFLA